MLLIGQWRRCGDHQSHASGDHEHQDRGAEEGPELHQDGQEDGDGGQAEEQEEGGGQAEEDEFSVQEAFQQESLGRDGGDAECQLLSPVTQGPSTVPGRLQVRILASDWSRDLNTGL